MLHITLVSEYCVLMLKIVCIVLIMTSEKHKLQMCLSSQMELELFPVCQEHITKIKSLGSRSVMNSRAGQIYASLFM